MFSEISTAARYAFLLESIEGGETSTGTHSLRPSRLLCAARLTTLLKERAVEVVDIPALDLVQLFFRQRTSQLGGSWPIRGEALAILGLRRGALVRLPSHAVITRRPMTLFSCSIEP